MYMYNVCVESPLPWRQAALLKQLLPDVSPSAPSPNPRLSPSPPAPVCPPAPPLHDYLPTVQRRHKHAQLITVLLTKLFTCKQINVTITMLTGLAWKPPATKRHNCHPSPPNHQRSHRRHSRVHVLQPQPVTILHVKSKNSELSAKKASFLISKASLTNQWTRCSR